MSSLLTCGHPIIKYILGFLPYTHDILLIRKDITYNTSPFLIHDRCHLIKEWYMDDYIYLGCLRKNIKYQIYNLFIWNAIENPDITIIHKNLDAIKESKLLNSITFIHLSGWIWDVNYKYFRMILDNTKSIKCTTLVIPESIPDFEDEKKIIKYKKILFYRIESFVYKIERLHIYFNNITFFDKELKKLIKNHFHNLKALRLNNVTPDILQYMLQYIPNVEELYIYNSSTNIENPKLNLSGLVFDKLHTIIVNNTPQEFMEIILHSPNIKHITFKNLNSDRKYNQFVVLKYVIKFRKFIKQCKLKSIYSINECMNNSVLNLYKHQTSLEELYISLSVDSHLLRIFRKLQNLRILKIYFVKNVQSSDMEYMINHLPKLCELRLVIFDIKFDNYNFVKKLNNIKELNISDDKISSYLLDIDPNIYCLILKDKNIKSDLILEFIKMKRRTKVIILHNEIVISDDLIKEANMRNIIVKHFDS